MSSKLKNVKLKVHHKKAYRKRHIGLLTLSLAGVLVALALLLWYRDTLVAGASSARTFVASLFPVETADSSKVKSTIKARSTHGVAVSYDASRLYGSAADVSTGRLYVGSELSRSTPYTSLRLSQLNAAGNTANPDSQANFTMTINPNSNDSVASSALTAMTSAGILTKDLTKQSDATVEYGGKSFSKSVWSNSESSLLGLSPSYSVYVTKVDKTLVTIVIASSVNSGDISIYEDVLKSLEFGSTVGSTDFLKLASVNQANGVNQASIVRAFDVITGASPVLAATNNSVDSAEKNSVLYSPAVVKVYNVYCMDIAVSGYNFMKDVCQGASGSGFIITGDGYVGTNGHVATADPRDIAIYNSVTVYVQKNDDRYLKALASLTDLTESDIAGKTAKEGNSILIDALYNISADLFVASNSVHNLMVSVSKNSPDMQAMVEATAARKEFSSNEDVVRAKLISSDYRSSEVLIADFKASDVALLKLETGSNYPTMPLGDITDITQGAGLSVIGYPGQASNNGLVSTDSVIPTVTSGKVSAVKDVSGGKRKVIETDATIGQGNSGGPALSESGRVVGVATYTIDGGGQGRGIFNYIRDIADFKALLGTSVNAVPSQTQTVWEDGVEKFYNSRYSGAVKKFEEVLELYPNHSKATEFIASAKTKIANGEDVSDFPLWIVWVGLGVLGLGASGATFLIIRHSKRHKAYNAGVAQGVVQPGDIARGNPQMVTVQPGMPVVQSMGVQMAAPQSVSPQTIPALTPVQPQPLQPTPASYSQQQVQQAPLPQPPFQAQPAQPTLDVAPAQQTVSIPIQQVPSSSVENQAVQPSGSNLPR